MRLSRQWRPAVLAGAIMVALLAVGIGRAVIDATATPADWVAARGPQTLVHHLIRAPWGTLYAATGLGVYRSDDDGTTWSAFGVGFPAVDAWGIEAVQASSGDVVLVAAGDGAVYRLAHAGGRWRRSGAAIGTDGAFSLIALHGAILAGSDRGIFRSTDGGLSWMHVYRVSGGAVSSFASDRADGALYAGLAGLAHSVLVSRDSGRSWHVPSAPLPPASVEGMLGGAGRVYAGVMGASGGRAVWRGGAHGFTSISEGLPLDAHGMALAEGNGQLLVGTMGSGVYSKGHGSSWSRLGSGPGDKVITALLVIQGAHPVVLAGTGEGIFRLALS